MRDDLKKVAHHIGYEWAMLLGACDTEWHKETLAVTERNPLRVVHLHARTELVWLHARVLYGFLFIKKPKSDDLSVLSFLDGQSHQDWERGKAGMCATDLCPIVESQCCYGGAANKKLFHATSVRLTGAKGLPAYTIARDELRKAFATCYGLMVGEKRDAFRAGLDDEWDVASFVLS